MDAKKPFDLSAWVECDTECYRNYWLAKFLFPDGRMIEFAAWPGQPLDVVGLRALLTTIAGVITFNGAGYDDPMMSAALMGYDCDALKNLNDILIPGKGKKGPMPWVVYRQYGIAEPFWQRIDISEVAPGVRISLKAYGGRMHAPRLQDLPIEPSAILTPLDRLGISTYCGNDLHTTFLLRKEVTPRLRLRHEVGEQYGIDVMSKSDAQIAEAVYRAKLPFKPQKTFLPHGHAFRYVAPDWISFVSPELKDVLAMVQRVQYEVKDPDQLRVEEDEKVYDSDGKEIKSGVKMPKEIKGRDIIIGRSTYRIGIGGLHSREKKVSYRAVPGQWEIGDHDVTSYYPTLMLLMNMFPAGTGPAFIEILREIYNTRLDAKHKAQACEKAGDEAGEAYWKTIADGLKIVLNGTYGKLGSRYSFLFAPELMIRTTLSGQLALLMLIEMLELSGIRVVSANTDGIVLLTPQGLASTRDDVIRWWELTTGLETEATPYRSIHSRDVNNYIAIKPDGKHKAKGVYGESGVSPKASPSGKHPGKDICNDAVIAFLCHGTPIEQTVRACKDIRRFLVVKNVAGGAVAHARFHPAVYEKDSRPPVLITPAWLEGGVYLGKAVRWYYGVSEIDCLRYKTNGNKVSSSDGAIPLMQLPDTFPLDVDYDSYIADSRSMLADLGVAG